jgi:hypothetical protein|tara:strand:- start:843 stop:1523 length:681 start_codon:yes stop_codon:yes gene_type:complete
MNKLIYLSFHNKFFDNIILNKRKEMVKLIQKELADINIESCLDIGSSSDKENKSTNYIIKNLNLGKIHKSITNQKIDDHFFSDILLETITKRLSSDNIDKFKSDLVISSATIEHVGSKENQVEMLKNMASLTKKTFIITTPNKYYPIEFHTKIPLLHFLPAKIFRKILKILNYSFYAKEENLNLLSEKDILNLLKVSGIYDTYKIKIKPIRLFFIKSNFIVFCKKK